MPNVITWPGQFLVPLYLDKLSILHTQGRAEEERSGIFPGTPKGHIPSASAVTVKPRGTGVDPKGRGDPVLSEPAVGALGFPERLQPFPGCGLRRAAFLADTKAPNPLHIFAHLPNKDGVVPFTASTV